MLIYIYSSLSKHYSTGVWGLPTMPHPLTFTASQWLPKLNGVTPTMHHCMLWQQGSPLSSQAGTRALAIEVNSCVYHAGQP